MDQPLMGLFAAYDTLVVLDTETSGLQFCGDEIIELAAVTVQAVNGAPQVTGEYDRLIRLSPGKCLDPRITELTGIRPDMLEAEGISKDQARADFAALMSHGRTLLAAYNAHFDLSFLYFDLCRENPTPLIAPDFLDVLSIYKDRESYPHKLKDAIAHYGLEDRVVNSHRAIDDVLATVEVLKAMDAECCDLTRYINLFGYNPKYGVQGRRIGSVRYVPQPYNSCRKLYEKDGEHPG